MNAWAERVTAGLPVHTGAAARNRIRDAGDTVLALRRARAAFPLCPDPVIVAALRVDAALIHGGDLMDPEHRGAPAGRVAGDCPPRALLEYARCLMVESRHTSK